MNKTSGGNVTNPSRRKFIVGSAAASGGLALGIPLAFGGGEAVAKVAASVPEVNAWVLIKPDELETVGGAEAAPA